MLQVDSDTSTGERDYSNAGKTRKDYSHGYEVVMLLILLPGEVGAHPSDPTQVS